MLGPITLLFALTNWYEPCIPSFFNAARYGGAFVLYAARITYAITSVAERDIPHWQLNNPTN